MSKLKIPVHPGRILYDEYLVPANISAGALAKHIGVPRTRIERLVSEQTSMTVDTAARLSAALGTTPGFWLNLQTNCDLTIYDLTFADEIAPLEMVSA